MNFIKNGIATSSKSLSKLRCCVAFHSRRHLVYAWGDSTSLPALEPRIEVVQSLLLLLSKLTDEEAAELKAEGLAIKTGAAADR